MLLLVFAPYTLCHANENVHVFCIMHLSFHAFALQRSARTQAKEILSTFLGQARRRSREGHRLPTGEVGSHDFITSTVVHTKMKR